jgi:hypothetical protein
MTGEPRIEHVTQPVADRIDADEGDDVRVD